MCEAQRLTWKKDVAADGFSVCSLAQDAKAGVPVTYADIDND